MGLLNACLSTCQAIDLSRCDVSCSDAAILIRCALQVNCGLDAMKRKCNRLKRFSQVFLFIIAFMELNVSFGSSLFILIPHHSLCRHVYQPPFYYNYTSIPLYINIYEQ